MICFLPVNVPSGNTSLYFKGYNNLVQYNEKSTNKRIDLIFGMLCLAVWVHLQYDETV